MNRHSYLVLVAVFISSSCSNRSTDPTRAELDFGNSVKQLVNSQTYHKKKLAHSKQLSRHPELDGISADNAIRAYRNRP